MTRVHSSEFPELRRVFSGYLHEDFVQEYGSAEAALRSFEKDASEEERQQFREEGRRFLEATAHLKLSSVHALLARLGCRWAPPDRDALAAALTGEA